MAPVVGVSDRRIYQSYEVVSLTGSFGISCLVLKKLICQHTSVRYPAGFVEALAASFVIAAEAFSGSVVFVL